MDAIVHAVMTNHVKRDVMDVKTVLPIVTHVIVQSAAQMVVIVRAVMIKIVNLDAKVVKIAHLIATLAVVPSAVKMDVRAHAALTSHV